MDARIYWGYVLYPEQVQASRFIGVMCCIPNKNVVQGMDFAIRRLNPGVRI